VPAAEDVAELPPALAVSAVVVTAFGAAGAGRGFFGGKVRILRPASVETDGGSGAAVDGGPETDARAGVAAAPAEVRPATAFEPDLPGIGVQVVSHSSVSE
jgi:hypothetical protein